MKKSIKAIIVGIIITVVGGLILFYLTNPKEKKDNPVTSTTNIEESNLVVASVPPFQPSSALVT